MWEVSINFLYEHLDKPASLEDLFTGLVYDRKKYGYPMAKIYSITDINDEVQLCVCEYPEDEKSLKKSRYAKKRRLVYSGRILNVPSYLQNEYNRVSGRAPIKKPVKKWWQF